ncbi:ribonuclease H-like domain-containing protein [Tanacetum coccineum]
MVSTEEMRIRNKSHSLSVSTNSSAPQVLLTETPHRVQDTRTNKERDNRNNNKTEVCRNFGRGVCRWGATCRGLDLASPTTLYLFSSQNTLLAQYGLSTISIPRTPIGFNNSGQRIVPAQPSAQQLMTHGLTPNQQALFTNAVQNTGNTSSNTGQETVLPTAFNTMTLQDPANANWHMDTGASSHLNSSAHNLSTIFNSRMYPSVLVGDGKFIPVTNMGHSTLPTPYHPLYLNNVLVTPNIVKNLISMLQFVRENKCTIEFDEFGFSVKDFRTRQILLRCDSTGDLYPVTSLSYPQAFLVGQQTWHQRLGHPESDVLHSLVSNNLISCNKTKSPVLCHACQLGKHVRLPFSLSKTIVKSPFDIIHSDLWTSPITSVSDGSLNRYKARLVANGNTQIVGIDVDETFSPVVKSATIHTVLSLAISRHWPVHQLDVKNAFLHRSLSETVYMHQPPGFRDPRHPDHVFLLQRSLYGLKQAPRAWFQRFAAYAARVDFLHSRCDSSLFIYRQGSDTAYLLLYVDDIVLTKYATEVLERAGILTCNPRRTPADMDSKLAAAGDPVCLFMHDPREPHFSALKRILRYIHGTLTFGLQLYSSTTSSLVAYSDADWAGCTIVYCDNVCVVYLSSNPVQHQRTKHIEIDIHFIRDLVTTGHIQVLHVPSRYQYADIFTKSLPTALFDEFRDSLSVRSSPAQTAGGC